MTSGDYFLAHRWDMCPMCGPHVVCSKCGNNCCNGGYGQLADGSTCDACPAAYDLQMTEPAPAELMERWVLEREVPQ